MSRKEKNTKRTRLESIEIFDLENDVEVVKAVEMLSSCKAMNDQGIIERTYDLGLSNKSEPFDEESLNDPSLTNMLIECKNQCKLARRIFYLEFRAKILSVSRHYNLPMDQSTHLLNCLDRYIPDCCLCDPIMIRGWMREIRKTPDKISYQQKI
jgi:hypothetical protein